MDTDPSERICLEQTVRLILFDIDGTLLTCGPQVAPIFSETLVEVFGRPGHVPGYDFGGKTDPQIVLDLMIAAGLPREQVHRGLAQMRRVYTQRLEGCLTREGMRLMPGVVELLERLARREELWVGLLTGNWEAGARSKLSRFDLNRFFPFGAFGDDGIERQELVPAAFERARKRAGRAFLPAETLIIGDTRHDVACAHAHGVRALAVATGKTSAGELRAAGADWVAPDLPSAMEMIPVLGPERTR